MNNFDELLEELKQQADQSELLSKAMADDNKKIQSASGEEDYQENPEDEDEDEEDDEDEEEGQTMTKSINVGDETFEVVDAEMMLKSIDAMAQKIEKLETMLSAAMPSMVKAGKSQVDMIKSMSSRIEQLAGSGAGRRSVLDIHERQSVIPKAQQTVSPEEVLAKAELAMNANKISPKEFLTLDIQARNKQSFDPQIMAKAFS